MLNWIKFLIVMRLELNKSRFLLILKMNEISSFKFDLFLFTCLKNIWNYNLFKRVNLMIYTKSNNCLFLLLFKKHQTLNFEIIFLEIQWLFD